MNELIKLNETKIDNELIQTVNARELHAFLESKQDFSTWIKKKLERLRLQVDKDYVIVPQKNGTIDKNGNKKVSISLEYFITLDTAKHIAMMENTDRGFEVRDYFIECEKQLKQVFSPKQKFLLNILEADDELSRAVAINAYEVGYVKPLENKVVEQAKQIESNKPKIRYHDIVLSCPDLLTVRQIAQDYGISAQRLNSILHEKKIQYKDKSGVWLLYISYNAQGYAQTFTHTYQDNDGNYHSKLHLKWTQKGRLFIYELLKEEGILPICEQED